MPNSDLPARPEGTVFLVTHYARELADDRIWLPIPFVARIAGDASRYYLGFNTAYSMTPAQVDERVTGGALCPLARSYPIRADEQLWLTPEHDVWIASSAEPLGDPGRRLVDSGSLRREKELRLRGASRAGSSPVVQSVIDSGSLRYVLGDYLNLDSPGSDYRVPWQGLLLDEIRQRLFSDFKLRVVPKQYQRIEHRYSHVASLILRHEVAVCLEAILCDEERESTKIAVVQLGNIIHYAIAFVSAGRVRSRLFQSTESGANWSGPKRWCDFVRDSDTMVFGHAETAADHMLDLLATQGLIRIEQKSERGRIRELVDELANNPNNAMIVCDVGVVAQLNAEWDGRDAASIARIQYLRVPYERPVPIGLAYDGGDAVWGALLTDAVQAVAASTDNAVQASLADSAHTLKEIGGIWTLPFGPEFGPPLLSRPATA